MTVLVWDIVVYYVVSILLSTPNLLLYDLCYK